MNTIKTWQERVTSGMAISFHLQAKVMQAEINDLRAHIEALEAGELPEPEPLAWFAFADSNGPVPLELYGWDEKACKYAVLMLARSEGWKGTIEGYLLEKHWTIKPVFTADQLRQAIVADRAKRDKEVREGWKLVPVEPTPEMVDAAFAGMVEDQDVMRQLGRRREMRRKYAAMLAAAPQPQEGGE